MFGLQQGTEPVNERSNSDVRATFLDTSKVEQVPASIRYRIDDVTRGRTTEILDWTAVAVPATTNTIAITAEQNRILNGANKRELRQVTVEATSGGQPFRSALQYEIVNILGTDNA